MSKFRFSSHNLNDIEKGRHSHPKIPIEKIICKTRGSIEDEKHILLRDIVNCTKRKENVYLVIFFD